MLYVILFYQSLCTLGQGRDKHLPKANSNDSLSFWYKWVQKSENELGLQSIVASPYSFHFRLSGTGGEIVDVWQQDSIWHGCFTKWVRDATEAEDTTFKYQLVGTRYLKKYQLSSTQAAVAGSLIRSSGICQLPSDEHIKGWIQGLDGREVIIQYSEKADYYLKNYWTPSFQHGLSEALLLQHFEDKLNEIINAKSVREAFFVDVPFPCFTTDGGSSVCRIVATTKYQPYERELTEYKRRLKRKKKQRFSLSKP